jgi:hypothetical protein
MAPIEQHPHTARRKIDDRKVGGAVTVEVAADHRAMTQTGQPRILRW